MKFDVGNISWNAQQFGKGEQLLLAFHGYGQDASVFRHVAELLEDRYTLLAVDLAFHGEHTPGSIPASFLFDRAYAGQWIAAILRQTGQSRIGLMGFSIGARIALAISSWFPDKVRELWLLAPDGLPVSTAYRFLTGTTLGNTCFNSFVKAPGLAFFLIRTGRFSGVLPKKVADFFHTEISTYERRLKLYNTWMAYRKALPVKTLLRKQAQSGALTCICVLGKHDAVIPFRRTKRGIQTMLPGTTLIALEAGHNLLGDKPVRKLSEFFRNKLR